MYTVHGESVIKFIFATEHSVVHQFCYCNVSKPISGFRMHRSEAGKRRSINADDAGDVRRCVAVKKVLRHIVANRVHVHVLVP